MKQLAAAEDCQQQEYGQEFNLQLQSPLLQSRVLTWDMAAGGRKHVGGL